MAITRYPPNTIWLGGTRTEVNDLAASEAITPGHLVDRFNNGGIHRWRKHATAAAETQRAVATEQSMLNLGVDDAYAAADLVEVSIGQKGSTFWMLIGSDTLVVGDKLESAGNGLLRKLASGVPLFVALESVTSTTSARIRVEVL